MIKNLLTSAIRNFRFNKLYALINLFGLTVAFTVLCLAWSYVFHEWSYDNYHENGERIYRVLSNNNDWRGFTRFPVMPAPMAPAFMEDFPEAEMFIRMSGSWSAGMLADGKNFFEEGWHFVDPEIFSMLTIEFLHGTASSALASSTSIVLTESMAMKLYGRTDILDEEIVLKSLNQDLGIFNVTGVIRDFPGNSMFAMQILTQFESTLKRVAPNNLVEWGNRNYQTFFLFNKAIDPAALQDRLDAFRLKYENELNLDNGKLRSHYVLQRLKDIHNDTSTAFENKVAVPSDRLAVVLIGAIIVLLLAGINYINLVTGRSITRAREIGVRKVVGALERNLLIQFLLESVLMCGLALVGSLLLTYLLLPYFNNLVERKLELELAFLVQLTGIGLLFGVMAGLYPAVVLSRMKPIKVLRGKLSTTPEGGVFQNALIVIQFSVSSVMLISALLIREQLIFIQANDPGYEREQIISMYWRDNKLSDYTNALRTELLRIPSIEDVSFASHMPNSITSQQTRRWSAGGEEKQIGFYTAYVDSKYIPLFNIEMAEGRNFNENLELDGNSFILNETAARELGVGSPTGMAFVENGGDTVRVIGVVKDFHFASVRQPIAPMRLRVLSNWISQLIVKFSVENPQETLTHLQQVAAKFAPEFPFKYSFFDDQFMETYKQERQVEAIVTIVTVIAFVIACLGVFGLITSSVNQRLKELGIRKVLGAGTIHLLWLLTKKLNFLILISLFIAIPLAYAFVTEWLRGFAYAIDVGITQFIFGAAVVFSLAWFTVIGKVLRAANLNPVDVLKQE